MKKDVQEAMEIIEKACASVAADLPTHQAIQRALAVLKAELDTSAKK